MIFNNPNFLCVLTEKQAVLVSGYGIWNCCNYQSTGCLSLLVVVTLFKDTLLITELEKLNLNQC